MTPSVLRSRPPDAGAAPAVASQRPRGRLDWHQLLGWLRDDTRVSEDDAQRVAKRFGTARLAA